MNKEQGTHILAKRDRECIFGVGKVGSCTFYINGKRKARLTKPWGLSLHIQLLREFIIFRKTRLPCHGDLLIG